MCPHGYHHNDFMATPALGTQELYMHMLRDKPTPLCKLPVNTVCMLFYSGASVLQSIICA